MCVGVPDNGVIAKTPNPIIIDVNTVMIGINSNTIDLIFLIENICAQ